MSETWELVSGWAEEGDSGEPKFGKKARRWFMRSLRAKLEANRFDIKDEELEPVLAWFAISLPAPYVTWENAETFRGLGYAAGEWTIDWSMVVRGCATALQELRAEAESARFPTLDDWLRAEVKGTLDSSGRMGGSAKLPKKLRRELKAASRARRKNRPRICRSCHAEFTPTCNRALRCKKCIDSDAASSQAPTRRTWHK